jgi:hypothetical protein
MKELINKYNEFLTNPTPSFLWRKIRFIIHWLTIPLKLIVFLLVYIVMQVYMIASYKKRQISPLPDKQTRKRYVKHILNNLPIYTNGRINLHVLRVPLLDPITGNNHNADHQMARHGVYSFIFKKLGLHNPFISRATSSHVVDYMDYTLLARGYKIEDHGYDYNVMNTSGDQLLGLLLASINDDDLLVQEKTLKLVLEIIKNDYSLMDPMPEGKINDQFVEYSDLKKRKAIRGMWQPGLETVGAQAITLLAALKVGANLGSSLCKQEYKKLFWLYGYGILSLIPTIFVPKKRGYFNDNNCITAAYILSKLSKNKLEKLFWNLSALYTWSLSYKWYNPYFTGMINELMPGIVSKEYTTECKKYLYEDLPHHFEKKINMTLHTKEFPVKYNSMNHGEFFVDEEQKISLGTPSAKAGLGWLAAATMIDPEETKELANDNTNI